MVGSSPTKRCKGWILAMGGLSAFALILRLIGIEFGLPGLFVFDEPLSVNHAVRFGAGSLHPPDLLYPTGYKYFLAASYGAFYVLGRAAGWFPGVEAFKLHWFTDPTPFFVIARSVSALAGTLSCVVVVGLGRQAGLPRVWAMAAGVAVAAGAGIHHVYSQVAKPDMPAACFMLAALWAVGQALHRDSPWRWAAGGMLTGLAVACKYNAVLLIPTVAVVGLWEMASRRPAVAARLCGGLRWLGSRLGVFGSGTVLVFLVSCPYAVLDHKMFLRDWRFLQQNHSLTASWAAIPSGLWEYFRLSFTDGQEGVGPLLTVMGLVGFALGIRPALHSDRRSSGIRLLLALSCVYAGFFASRTQGHPIGQYLLPMAPVWVLWATVAVWRLHHSLHERWPRSANVAASGLFLAGIASSLVQAVPLDLDTYREDPRVAASTWLETHLPAGSKVFIEGDGIQYPRPTVESFQREREYMAERFRTLGLPAPDYRPERAQAVANAPEPKFDLGYYWLPPRFLSEVRATRLSSFSPFMLPIDNQRTDPSWWLERGYRHFVLQSDQIEGRIRAEGCAEYPTLCRFYRSLTEKGRVVAKFEPHYRVRRAPTVTVLVLEPPVDSD